MKTPAQTFRDQLLVLRAQSGDREALDRLLRSVQAALYGYIRRLLGEPALAEDVLQDVFVIICRKLRFLREPSFFRAWAYRIASRRALRVAGRERRRAGLSFEDAGIEPEALAGPAREPAYDPDLIAAVPSFLAALSPGCRAVLTLHYLEDMTLREIADVLELPVGTVKSRLSYGLASIRGRLNQTTPPTSATRKETSND